jgi:bacteriorhodopsin
MTIHRGWYRGASLVFTTIPFAFAATRARQTGSDFRYLWLAIASFVGAAAVVIVMRRASVAVRFVVAMLVATLMAGLVAIFFLGTNSGPGLWIVALGFGFCSAAGAVLRNRVN